MSQITEPLIEHFIAAINQDLISGLHTTFANEELEASFKRFLLQLKNYKRGAKFIVVQNLDSVETTFDVQDVYLKISRQTYYLCTPPANIEE